MCFRLHHVLTHVLILFELAAGRGNMYLFVGLIACCFDDFFIVLTEVLTLFSFAAARGKIRCFFVSIMCSPMFSIYLNLLQPEVRFVYCLHYDFVLIHVLIVFCLATA
jgi:hypothetical protein